MFVRLPHRGTALLLATLVAAAGAFAAPSPAAAQTGALAVHGVTGISTDLDTCATRVEVGFRPEIADLPLSNGRLDPLSVSAATMLIDGVAATSYATRTDLSVAPFYFAILELATLAPGSHVIAIAGGQAGVTWRAFDHSNPDEEYVGHLEGDYHLAFTVPPCGPVVPVGLSGFRAPIDGEPTLNVARRGLTVPLRFSATRGDAQLTDPGEFVVSVARARCDATAPLDRVERYVQPDRAGELFHDPVAGAFVYRWTVPRGKHPCWDVTVTHQSGATLTAHFRTFAAGGTSGS